MNKNMSDKNRTAREPYQTQSDTPMASRNQGLKFVSDDDIVGRADYRRVRPLPRTGKEPKFVSDEDIVSRRAA
jgi:hypothetical protein